MTIAVTIDPTTPTTQSVFSPGMTHVDNTLAYPFGPNDLAAVNSARILSQVIPWQNSHIMEWGISDPWPDPTQAEPSIWALQDARIQLIVNAGAAPIITFCEAPWWMKGHLNNDGTTGLIPDVNGENGVHTYASGITDYRGLVYAPGYVSPDPYTCRILDNQMSNWIHLVQRVAERYMVAPYNVRYFQVWNEMKGYFNNSINGYDYTTNAGDNTGYNAKHGYTYMYNQVYAQLMTTAAGLGIPTSSIKVGGPYPNIGTWSTSSAGGFPTSEPALQNKPYGYYDDRNIQVVKYWLQNKTGAGIIIFDGGGDNKDGIDICDYFTWGQKMADMVTWIRSLNNTTYPGAATLPIWWSEWYFSPHLNYVDDNYNAAVKANALSLLIKAGGTSALIWGSSGTPIPDSGLWTTTTAGGGQPKPWYSVYQSLHTAFSPGTQLYAHTNSDTSSLEVLPGYPSTMLINKTNSDQTVTVNGQHYKLSAYQTRTVVVGASFGFLTAHI